VISDATATYGNSLTMEFCDAIGGSLLGWVESVGDEGFIGAFVGEAAVPDPSPDRRGRPPATKLFPTPAEARCWIAAETAAFGLPVKWVERASMS
jgi:hypothetical protein